MSLGGTRVRWMLVCALHVQHPVWSLTVSSSSPLLHYPVSFTTRLLQVQFTLNHIYVPLAHGHSIFPLVSLELQEIQWGYLRPICRYFFQSHII